MLITTDRSLRLPTYQPLKRFFRTPKGYVLLMLSFLTVMAGLPASLGTVLPGELGAMLGAAVLDVGLARVLRGAWIVPTGALLSGMFVALILSLTEPFPVVVVTGMLAVNTKYLFQLRGRHVFNPAAFALVASSILFSSGQSWWGAMPDLPMPGLLVLVGTGWFIADRVNKMPAVLIYLGTSALLFTVASFVLDPARVAEVFRAPDVNATLFFAFFMVTDPPTSPTRYRDQVIYGFIVAMASVVIYLTLSGLYFLPAGLLVGNAWEACRRAVTLRSPSAPQIARTAPRQIPQAPVERSLADRERSVA